MDSVNEMLVRLFEEHGQAAVLNGPGILFPGKAIKASGLVVRENPFPNGISVQLDVRCEVEPRRIILESFAGVGTTKDDAVSDAVKNFANSSFHVLLDAFFQMPSHQVTREEWMVNGSRRLATIGGIVCRGQFPPITNGTTPQWLQHLVKTIQGEKLGRSTHWIRLFYAQNRKQVLSSEVLLDNQPWLPVHAAMAAFPWPDVEEFYSLRIFLVLQNL